MTCLEIINAEIGRVVGKGGVMIREMEQTSGCKIDIDKRANVIAIRGPQKDREKVEKMIIDEVSWCRRAGSGEVLKTDFFNDGREGVGGEGSGDDFDPNRLREKYGEPIEFFVLDKEAGRVIGRSGEVVKEIM